MQSSNHKDSELCLINLNANKESSNHKDSVLCA